MCSCGNDWANDTFDRHFTVEVVEQFKDGSFTTNMGFSPGACQTGPPAGLVNAGVVGSFDGYFIIPGVTTQMSTDPRTATRRP